MQYEASQSLNGDPIEAFRLAESALTAIGFRITQRSSDSLQMVGPGMNSNRESALVGASRIHIRKGHDNLTLEADLGGVERLSRFVRWFPLGLTLFLCIVFAVVFGAQFGPGPWMGVVAAVMGGNALIWLVLGPVLARSFRARTCRGLDTLLANMVAVGRN